MRVEWAPVRVITGLEVKLRVRPALRVSHRPWTSERSLARQFVRSGALDLSVPRVSPGSLTAIG